MGNPRESGKDTFGCFQVESSSKCCLVWETCQNPEMASLKEVKDQITPVTLPKRVNNIIGFNNQIYNGLSYKQIDE
jgi:hypothetical protein